jgi:hypothetical protein
VRRLTAAETSFSLSTTSRIMSLRAFSSSTVVVSVENDDSRSSRSVFESRFCSDERSFWILLRFSAMFGLPFRLRHSSLVDSRSARATSLICSWFSLNFVCAQTPRFSPSAAAQAGRAASARRGEGRSVARAWRRGGRRGCAPYSTAP